MNHADKLIRITRTAGALLLALFLLSWIGMRAGGYHSVQREGAWSLMKAVFWVWCCWIPLSIFVAIRFRKHLGWPFVSLLMASVSVFFVATITDLLR